MNDIDCEIQNVIDEIRIDENSSEYSWVIELTLIVERNLTASTHAYEYVINIIQNLNDYDKQHYAPLSTMSQEDVEKEVIECMTRALKYLEVELIVHYHIHRHHHQHHYQHYCELQQQHK
ncbi:unnamed protein product [Rotaria sordida]|uniref:EDRF1 TPR repeats region domain-containing protein n=1 Tax=Rotaria sordida TaxID=392033 RepID=A0A819VJS9_9BILA|nr:unnamed protein product [Rotaria sordida]